MESIANQVNRRKLESRIRPGLKSLEEEIKELLAQPEIVQFIAKHEISQQALERSYSKLFEYQSEKAKYLSGESTSYEPVLVENEGFIDVAYRPSESLIQKQEESKKQKRIQLYGMPKGLREIRWTDISLDDPRRQELYIELGSYISNPQSIKGLYIFGDFGVGKTYMLAAMTNELAAQGKTVALIHYPTFCLDLNFQNVKEKVNEVKKADVLVLDDIGGELNNTWLRDSVLQVILQYRMQENLATFFTSNLSMNDLENHLAETKKTEDLWSSKRVMERVKYLAKEIHLQGENRRHG